MSIRIWWFIWARTNSPDSPLVFTADKYGTAVPGCAQRKPREQFFGVLPFYPSPCLELEELIATPFLTVSWQFDTIQAMPLALLGRWCYQCNDHPYLSWKNSGSNIESHSPPGDLESRVFQFNESSIFESGSKAIAQKKTEGCLWSISIYPGRCTKLGQVWCCAWTWNFCSS